MTKTPRPNVGYYGRLETVKDGQFVPLYTTPELPHDWGLFRMADHLRALALRMGAASYQLRRNVAGHDRAQGCIMMLVDGGE